MKLKQLFTDFSAGEIGSRLGGRIDTGILQKGAKEITNMIIQEDGGATKRTGTKKIVPTLDYDDDTGEWAGRRSRIISTVISGNQPYLVEFSHLKARLANADDNFTDPTDNRQPDINITKTYTSVVEGYSGYVPAGEVITSKLDAAHIWFTPSQIANNNLQNTRDLAMFRLDGASVNNVDLYEVEFSLDGLTSWISQNSFLVDNINQTPNLKTIRFFSNNDVQTVYNRNKFNQNVYGEKIPNPSAGQPIPPIAGGGVEPDFYPGPCQNFDLSGIAGTFTSGHYLLARIPAALNIGSISKVFVRIRNVSQNSSFKNFEWNKSTQNSTSNHPTLRLLGITPVNRIRTSWGEWGFVSTKSTFATGISSRGGCDKWLDSVSLGYSTLDHVIDITTPSIVGDFVTPYNEEEIFQLKYVQIEKTLIIVHPNHPMKKLEMGISSTFTDLSLTDPEDYFDDDSGADKTNYPSSCAFFQGRLYLAGTISNPNRVWASVAGQPTNFTFTAASPASAFFFTLNSQRSNRILWMEGRSELILGTASAEWRVTGTNGLVTATTVFATRQTTFGSSGIQGRLINDAIFFVQRDNRRLREYIFSNESQAYNSLDVTVYSPHIAQSSVVDVAFSQDPDNIIYEVLGNGDMAICTYNKAKQVMAWSRIRTDGNFESIAIVAGVANEDDIWAVVNRDGRRHIERFSFRSEFSAAEPVYLDSHITIFNPPTTTVAGLNHLEGKEVYYLVDGEYFPPKTVENGEIELDSLGSTVHIGLPFTSRITTNRLDSQVGIGVLKRVVKVKARVYKTIGLKAGPSAEEQMFRIADDQAFRRVEPREEDVEIYYPGGFDKDGYVELIHDYPLPFTLLALQIDYEASEV